jgi:septal ring factor EnvC (AmiA/AmiB activator)
VSIDDSVSKPQIKKQLSQKRTSLSNKEREELKKIEKKIETLEARKAEINAAMIEYATDHEKMALL